MCQRLFLGIRETAHGSLVCNLWCNTVLEPMIVVGCEPEERLMIVLFVGVDGSVDRFMRLIRSVAYGREVGRFSPVVESDQFDMIRRTIAEFDKVSIVSLSKKS